jgi:hypothetical protein
VTVKICSGDGKVLWNKTMYSDPPDEPDFFRTFNMEHEDIYCDAPYYHDDIPKVLEKCFTAMENK